MDKERATRAGSLLKIIYLLTPELRKFTERTCQNIDEPLGQYIHQQDFHEILRFIQIHWNDVFAPKHYAQHKQRIISQAIITRNRICHENFLAIDYLRLLKKLESLALMINCDRKLIDIIDEDFYRVSVSQTPLADARRVKIRAQMYDGDVTEQGYIQTDCNLQFNTPEKAIEYYSEQIFRDVNGAASYYKRAKYEIELEQYDLALEDLEDAVDLDKYEKPYIDRRNRLLFKLKRESNFRPLFHWFSCTFTWLFPKLFLLVRTADVRALTRLFRKLFFLVRAQQSLNKIRSSDKAIDVGASFYHGEDGLEKNLTLAQICWSKVKMEKDEEI